MVEQSQGHRKRLLERFQKQGLSALHDYEIVELLLSYAIPRKDTKKIAKQLIQRYGSVSGILNAPTEDISGMEGITPRVGSLLSLIHQTGSYCLREKLTKQSIIKKREDVEQYLRFRFGLRRDEYVAALYLDTGNRCIATEIIGVGTVNQCAIYPRKILERGFVHGAAGVILAHNHPGGAAEPSRADWLITERVYTIGKLVDMPMLDHIIILHDAVISLRDYRRWPAK